MKKLIALALALIMVFALCACGNTAEPAAPQRLLILLPPQIPQPPQLPPSPKAPPTPTFSPMQLLTQKAPTTTSALNRFSSSCWKRSPADA